MQYCCVFRGFLCFYFEVMTFNTSFPTIKAKLRKTLKKCVEICDITQHTEILNVSLNKCFHKFGQELKANNFTGRTLGIGTFIMTVTFVDEAQDFMSCTVWIGTVFGGSFK